MSVGELGRHGMKVEGRLFEVRKKCRRRKSYVQCTMTYLYDDVIMRPIILYAKIINCTLTKYLWKMGACKSHSP